MILSLLFMELCIVAAHQNRLDEAILIDDTMYSLTEKIHVRKMLQIYINFSFPSGVTAKIQIRQYVIFVAPRKFDTADILQIK